MSVPVRSATELAETIKYCSGLLADCAEEDGVRADILAATAALVALAERAEDERDVAVKEHSRLLRMLRMEGARADAAEARVAELERQRNEARTQRARLYLIERERVAELETTLKRIIAQFETNSEAGAPQYLFDALAAGSPTGQEQQA